MTDGLSGAATRAEAVFTMEPESTLMNLIDLLVKSQTAYARVVTQTREFTTAFHRHHGQPPRRWQLTAISHP